MEFMLVKFQFFVGFFQNSVEPATLIFLQAALFLEP